MRALRARGVAVVFVSHRLAEVFEISDRIIIMRDGRISGTFMTADTSRDAVVDQMIGASVSSDRIDRETAHGETALEARGLVVRDPGGKQLVGGVSFAVRRGEVVGLFGLLGSGVIETAMAMFGAWRGPVAGSISVAGNVVDIANPADAVAMGIGLIAQDRRDGLSSEHSIFDNAILANLSGLSWHGFVDAIAGRRKTLDIFERLNIKAPGIDVPVGSLSGGNQQKVQIARWLATGARILLLIDPTRGVDVGARAEIKRIWTELADAGCAILLVSSDAEEIVEICDRALVLRNGCVAGEIEAGQLSESRLLKLAAGV
jgi:ABC-type sugar transport system ATPase subunit